MLSKKLRTLIGLLAVTGLCVFFLVQKIDFVALVYKSDNPAIRFIANRSLRFLINDILAILLIYALFVERKYIIFALWVQVFGLVFLLIPYFTLKLYYPSYNGPLINFLHRIVLNPTLIMLLIPAFYYQKRIADSRSRHNEKD